MMLVLVKVKVLVTILVPVLVLVLVLVSPRFWSGPGSDFGSAKVACVCFSYRYPPPAYSVETSPDAMIVKNSGLEHIICLAVCTTRMSAARYATASVVWD